MGEVRVTTEKFANANALGQVYRGEAPYRRLLAAARALGFDFTAIVGEMLSVALAHGAEQPVEVAVMFDPDDEVIHHESELVGGDGFQPLTLVCERRQLGGEYEWISVRETTRGAGDPVQAFVVFDQTFCERYPVVPADVRCYQVIALGVGEDDDEVRRAVRARRGG